jgi:hypothetical protein
MPKATKARGTKADHWKLTTPPGASEYTMYRDDEKDPALIVCQVGSTTLTYLARGIEDLHAMLKKAGDWVPLGSAARERIPLPAPWRRGGARRTTRSRVGTARRKA